MGEQKTFDTEAISELEEKTKEYVNEWEESIQEQKNKTTPKGRKSKTAKDAENQEILAEIGLGVLTGLNQFAKKYAPELEHTEEEIETISKLSAPIASKHFDIDTSEYKEEYKLLSYLIVAEAPKVDALLRRIKQEAKERREAKQKEAKKKTREGLEIPLNNKKKEPEDE